MEAGQQPWQPYFSGGSGKTPTKQGSSSDNNMRQRRHKSTTKQSIIRLAAVPSKHSSGGARLKGQDRTEVTAPEPTAVVDSASGKVAEPPTAAVLGCSTSTIAFSTSKLTVLLLFDGNRGISVGDGSFQNGGGEELEGYGADDFEGDGGSEISAAASVIVVVSGDGGGGSSHARRHCSPFSLSHYPLLHVCVGVFL
ncbi:hypothetical protein PIB30_086970 [Stylosanthes scabra]|uniref:Uncharacterized protein n=1 Tax=Stylosanthes scabra TaxID=79078 RepID=A0ABU6RT72_9FABA|nr:hypothetical protein [Stylosanthes scabra]